MKGQHRTHARLFALSALWMLGAPAGWSHQPVMDMAPRWNGGYGIQIRTEHLTRDELQQDGVSLENALDLRLESTTTWLEGVYTFRRAHRLTFKLPHIQTEQRLLQDGEVRSLRAAGVGDLILGFQNKAYFNRKRSTGNVSFTPSVRLPTGSTSRDLPLGKGSFDYGASLSASVEMFKLYSLFDAFGWLHTEGDDGHRRGNMVGFDIDLGVHPYHNFQNNSGIFVMSGINGRWFGKDKLSSGADDPNSGGRTLEIAPTLVLYWNNLMWRSEVAIPVASDLNGTQFSQSSTVRTGIGIVFASRSPL